MYLEHMYEWVIGVVARVSISFGDLMYLELVSRTCPVNQRSHRFNLLWRSNVFGTTRYTTRRGCVHCFNLLWRSNVFGT